MTSGQGGGGSATPEESSVVGTLQTASNDAVQRTLDRATKRTRRTDAANAAAAPQAPTRIVREARRAALEALKRLNVADVEVAEESPDTKPPRRTVPTTALQENPRALSPAADLEKDIEWESAWTEGAAEQPSPVQTKDQLEVVLELDEEGTDRASGVSRSQADSTGSDADHRAAKRRRGSLATKRKMTKTFSAAERANALRIHRIHLLCMLASSLTFDRLSSAATIQARALSLVPCEVIERFDRIPEDAFRETSSSLAEALTYFVVWFASNYRQSSFPCEVCCPDESGYSVPVPRTPHTRLEHAMLHGLGGEQELVALACAMLRALLGRLNFQSQARPEGKRVQSAPVPDGSTVLLKRYGLVRFVAGPNIIGRKPEHLELVDQGSGLPTWQARLSAILEHWFPPAPADVPPSKKQCPLEPPLNRKRPGKPLRNSRSSHGLQQKHAMQAHGVEAQPPAVHSKASTLDADTGEASLPRRALESPQVRQRDVHHQQQQQAGRGLSTSKTQRTRQNWRIRDSKRTASALESAERYSNPRGNTRSTYLWAYQIQSAFLAPWRVGVNISPQVAHRRTAESSDRSSQARKTGRLWSLSVPGRWNLTNADPYRVPQYWLEVWDPTQQHWIHLDPLRCLVDDPLAVTVLPWWTRTTRPLPRSAATGQRDRHLNPSKTRSLKGDVSNEPREEDDGDGNRIQRPKRRSSRLRPDATYNEMDGRSGDRSQSESDTASSELETPELPTNRWKRERAERVVPYIFALEHGFGRDVTRRYTTRFQPVLEARSLDGHRYWTEEVLPMLSPFQPRTHLIETEHDAIDDDAFRERSTLWNALDNLEQNEFWGLHEAEPIPRSISALKNHPAFVLEEHLKKYEAIHPKVAIGNIQRLQPNGRIQTIPVYRRRDVHLLHTRERWFRECRIVRESELPYKIVQSFMSRFRQRREERRRERRQQAPEELEDSSTATAGPTELFGIWQTDPMPRPRAENGIVPRCGLRGNIELWTPNHLPLGTTHVDLPFAAMFARRLGFDFVPAMVGFEVRACGFVPAIRGVVVCTENAAALTDACEAEIKRRRERAEKRMREDALRRWRQLIRTIVAKERLRKRYGGFQVQDTNATFSSRKAGKQTSSSSAAEPAKRERVPAATAAGADDDADQRAAHEHEWVFVGASNSQDALGRKQCALCGLCVTYESLL